VPNRAHFARSTGLWLPLLAPLAILAFDWGTHPYLFAHYGRLAMLTYVGTALLSTTIWWGWASLNMHRERVARIVGTVALVIGGTILVGGQRYVVDRYGVLVDRLYVSGGTSGYGGASTILWNDRWTLVRAVLPPLLVLAIVAILLLRARTRVSPAPARISLPVAVIATFAAVWFASPSRYAEGAEPLDVLGLSAVGEAMRSGFSGAPTGVPGTRTPKPLPEVHRASGVPTRNVLLVLTESVRASSTCLDLSTGCPEAPFSHRMLPNRLVFRSMHSLASTTTPAITVLWSGLSPAASREEIHTVPFLWDYAKSAGFDSAYWTAQDLMFGNLQAFLEGIPARHRVNAAELNPDRDALIGADEHLLAKHVEEHALELREPFVAVVHLSNTHGPYRVDMDDLPYLPQGTEGGTGHEAEVYNRYRDAIYAQDKQLARILRAIRNRPGGDRTVILYTSDHGEQFRERGTIGHSNTLSEPEIHVPFWIDAPPGTLTAEERSALEAAQATLVTHAAILPTILDLMGVHDDPAITAARASFASQSLLRRPTPDVPPIILTNCSGVAHCLRPTWGAIQGPLKVWANDKDTAWNCNDVVADPKERKPLTGAQCDLVAMHAEASGRGTPFHALQ
jgi:glucan phosphoethanolaminetransferase (alkaline phosphatase superfamily)